MQRVLPRPVTFAMGNAKKLEEVRTIIGNSIPLQSPKLDQIFYQMTHVYCYAGLRPKVDLVFLLSTLWKYFTVPELQGEPEDISKEKARLAAQQVNGPVLVEDTCLCFNALNGLPGLNYILKADDDKSAYAICIFSLALGRTEEPITFVGKTQGIIVPPRGPNDFGWDPISQLDGYDQDVC